MQGTLFLLPSPLGEDSGLADFGIPASSAARVRHVKFFLAENLRSARRYLRELELQHAVQELAIDCIDRKHAEKSVGELLQPLLGGHDVALLSEAGCPCVADPGSEIVLEAQRYGIRVIPLPGPSSILLALMASGLNGQNFAFNGYLPKESAEREQAIKNLEERSAKTKASQIFIETPYRNQTMLESILKVAKPATLLCIAQGLLQNDEWIATRSVAKWREAPPQLSKTPAVFLLQG